VSAEAVAAAEAAAAALLADEEKSAASTSSGRRRRRAKLPPADASAHPAGGSQGEGDAQETHPPGDTAASTQFEPASSTCEASGEGSSSGEDPREAADFALREAVSSGVLERVAEAVETLRDVAGAEAVAEARAALRKLRDKARKGKAKARKRDEALGELQDLLGAAQAGGGGCTAAELEAAAGKAEATCRQEAAEAVAEARAAAAELRAAEKAAALERQEEGVVEQVATMSLGRQASRQGPGVEQTLDTYMCVVCLEKPKSVVLLPCRHSCLCEECAEAQQWERCPLCREVVEDTIRTFI